MWPSSARNRFRAVRPWMLRLVGLFDAGARETVEMADEFERAFVRRPTALADVVAETVAATRR